ncbi:hypothetical protein bAD24_I11565 [Burkholderia sp. AD24]|nr:hypothetical protein bAD24_I11565 [Burkholderia sp. AD24]
MPGFNFADKYKKAAVVISPDILKLRQGPFDKLRVQIDAEMAVDLTRLYFGLPVPAGIGPFVSAFAETDLTFSAVDSEREIAVLAVCLLEAAVSDGKAYAALAPLTASAAGTRAPLLCPEFIEYARHELGKMAIVKPSENLRTLVQNTLPEGLDGREDDEEENDASDAPEAEENTATRALELSQDLAAEVRPVLQELAARVETLQQESDAFWWYVGEWSRSLNRPLDKLEPAARPLVSGFDLGSLARFPAGPAAASAVLYRIVERTGKEDVTIAQAVEAAPSEFGTVVAKREGLRDLCDICPILGAVALASDVGPAPAWKQAYAKKSALNLEIEIEAEELAVQTYREALLLKALMPENE